MPPQVTQAANVQLTSGAPFISDTDLHKALDSAGVPDEVAQAIVDENEDARIVAFRESLSVLAIAALIALFPTRLLPEQQPAEQQVSREEEQA